MKKYDMTIKFHDKEFGCEGNFSAKDCERLPFSDEVREQLEEFERDFGEIKSITYKFKK